MSDIKFDCPHCFGKLVVDARGVGSIVDCPSCGKPIQIPAVNSANVVETSEPMSVRTKTQSFKCPECNNEFTAESSGGFKGCCPVCSIEIEIGGRVVPPKRDESIPSEKRKAAKDQHPKTSLAEIFSAIDKKRLVRLTHKIVTTGVSMTNPGFTETRTSITYTPIWVERPDMGSKPYEIKCGFCRTVCRVIVCSRSSLIKGKCIEIVIGILLLARFVWVATALLMGWMKVHDLDPHPILNILTIIAGLLGVTAISVGITDIVKDNFASVEGGGSDHDALTG